MKVFNNNFVNFLFLIILLMPVSAYSACLQTGVQLQVLGSGGPGHASGRASSAYVVWINGESRILVDAGSGTKNLFHLSGATVEQIDLIALTHLHPDHASELPAILWPGGGSFTLAGPDGDGVFPSIREFSEKMFGSGGVFAILADRIDYDIVQLERSSAPVIDVWSAPTIEVTAAAVPHGDVPTLGYRIEAEGNSIGFTSDQNGSDPGFIDFIRGVDYLVIHLAGNEDSTGLMAFLHAKPSVWGQMATAAGVGHVIISHISAPEPDVLEQNLAILSENYDGLLTVAEDLMCISLD